MPPARLSTSVMNHNLHAYWYLPLLPSRRASPHFGRYSFSVPLRV